MGTLIIRKCGNCAYWMNHHVCEYERWDKGRWHGPDMGGLPCNKHKTREELKKELANEE